MLLLTDIRWVFSSSLPSDDTSGHTVFNSADSSTFTDYEGATWKISYGDGSSASGTVGYDHVVVGAVTATKQAVELATAVSGSFVTDTANDGLVGLGFSNINTVQPTQQNTFFANVMSQLASPVFTADLQETDTGSYTFGAIDTSKISGDVHYVDVDNSNGYWQFTSNSYAIAGTSADCTTCSPAIADTGTSLMLVDADIATAYYAQVDGAQFDENQGGYVYDCSATLPSFGVDIGGYTATIQGSDLTYAQVDGSSCYGGIQSNSGEGIQIYGDVFLKNYLAVFDGGNTQFGVGVRA